MAAGAAALLSPSPATAFDFKTPGEAAYCRMEFTARQFDAFRCITPNDGFWIRFDGLARGRNVTVTKGYNAAYRQYRRASVQLLPFGRSWSSSDAQVIVCTSRSTGLTCKHPPTGLSFWLGRYRGYRIYYAKPGFPLRVRPFFRTPMTWCGLNLDTLAPENPVILCWHPMSGVLAGVAHDDASRGASARRSEQAKAYRPRRFPLLRAGATFVWRCRSVDEMSAERCSTSSGAAVFTCSVTSARVTCRNIGGRGFFIDNRGGFHTF